MSYSEVSVAELEERGAADIQTGPFGTQLKASDYTTAGIPVINVRNIGFGDLRCEKLEFISEATAERLCVHLLQQDDVVFGRKGAVDRHLFVAKEQSGWLQGSDCIRLRLSPKLIEARFVSYAFLRPYHKEWMLQQCGNKATMASLNQDIIRRIALPFPRLEQQREIISILSGYDDLIENNRKRIALLEEAGRLLYREWFVHLRFPGHEHAKFVDGLPERWERRALELVSTDGNGIQTGPFGSQLHQSDYSDTGVPVVMPKDLLSFRIDPRSIARVPDSIAEKLSRHRMVEGDTVYGRRGDIGRRGFVGVAQEGWLCGTGCLRIRADRKKINPRFLFDTLGSPDTAGTIANRAKGATMLNLNATLLKSVPVLIPPRPLQDLYAEQVQPMVELVESLSEQNTKLMSARNLLLPRLMSGEIAV